MIELQERKAEIQPVRSKLKISILEDEEIQKINQAALDILAEVGISFPSKRALKVFADAGAQVAFDKGTVRIPRDLVVKTLAHAPKRFTLAGRRPDLDLKIGDEKGTYFACAGPSAHFVDFETGERRRPVQTDVADMTRVADYLPMASLVWPPAGAFDKGRTAPLHALEACFSNTEKHTQTESVLDPVSAVYAVEMASAVSGVREKAGAVCALLLCTIAPLGQDGGGIESAMTFAEAGLPVGFQSMPTFGLTAPPYQAGGLATGLAEVLSGCVLTQIIRPGTPSFISIVPGVIDPRSAEYHYASPFSQVAGAAAVQLAHSNGLPVLSGCSFGGSARRLGDWQVGVENLYLQLLAVMAGADMTLGPSGLMETGSLLDMRRILFDREIFQAIDIISSGIQVTEGTLAMDMIREIGPRGNYLPERRTAEEVRKLWPPSILLEKPETAGEKYADPVEKAREAVAWILKNHQPVPLPCEVSRELRRIVDAADRDKSLGRGI